VPNSKRPSKSRGLLQDWELELFWNLLTACQRRSRASAQVRFISPLCPGQHRGLRPRPNGAVE